VTFDTIHTIDARDNVLLDVMQEGFALSSLGVRRAIRAAADDVIAILESKGIAYSDLKSALTPQKDKHEAVWFFDRMAIEDTWYGRSVHDAVLACIDRSGPHSILHGDLLGSPQQQSWLESQVRAHLVPSGNKWEWIDSRQLFCIYVNNLSGPMIQCMHARLTHARAFVGYADTTLKSPLKVLLSLVLPQAYLLHGDVALQAHADDLPSATNENTLGYPFERHGYRCRSIGESLAGLLLSYKIERPVLPGFETDTRHSLTAISDSPRDLESTDIVIEPAKLNYLAQNKAGSIELITRLSRGFDLTQLIKSKLRSNYIYSLAFSAAFDVAKFNIMLEVGTDSEKPARFLAALEYRPTENTVRLITLY